MSQDAREEVLRVKLDDLRNRLLNLNTRNKLLSTKFSERSRQHFRIIDELPDVLFDKLAKALSFKPLPDEGSDPQDEKKPRFREALAQARLIDRKYQDAVEALEEQSIEDESEEWRWAERELKDRVREELGMAPRPDAQVTGLEAHARHHGLLPSYDLPRRSDAPGDPAKWKDNDIQLLMLPDTMARRVEAVRDQARLYEQERGINVLAVAFGFLEWVDTEKSNRKHHAPLLLRRSRLTRRQSPGGYRYEITAEEDVGTDNETLREFLRTTQGIALPTLQEEETPEQYWERVQRDVADGIEGWKVRRWISVGVFPFENIVITEEMAEHGDRLLAAPLVGEILDVGRAESEESGEPSLISENTGGYQDSASDKRGFASRSPGSRPPALIADADSSQEAAIQHVLDGGNLALKGPPGTGKSQTITNLIGAALDRGKSVLFVAEKNAALEVVASRLTASNLGPFCLELHSEHAKSSAVLQSLRERDELPSESGGKTLNAKLEQLAERRQELDSYVRHLSTPYGRSGHTVQEILWLARSAEDRANLSPALRQLDVSAPAEIDDDFVARTRLLLDQIAKDYHEVFRAPGFTAERHPWRGFARENATPFDRERVLDQTQLLLEATEAALQDIRRLEATHPNGAPTSLAAARDQSAALGEIATRIAAIPSELVSAFRDNGMRTKGGHLCEARTELAQIETELAHEVDTDSVSARELREGQREIDSLGLTDRRLDELEGLGDLEFTLQTELQTALTQLGTFRELTGLEVTRAAHASLLVDAMDLVSRTSADVLRTRSSALTEEDAPVVLQRARSKAESLVAIREGLARELHLERVPSIRELEDDARTLRAAGTFAFLSGKVRAARRAFASITRASRKRTPVEEAEILTQLAEWVKESQQFDEDPQLRALCGSNFQGSDTDFDLLDRTTEFVYAVRNTLPPLQGIASGLRDLLLNGETDLLSAVTRAIDLTTARSLFKPTTRLNQDEEISQALTRQNERTERFRALLDRVRDWRGLNARTPLAQLSALADRLDQRRSLAERLDSDPFLRSHPEVRQSLMQDPAEVLRVIEVANQIQDLPGIWPEVLFREPSSASSIAEHLVELRDRAEEIARRFADLTESAQLQPPLFLDGDSPERVGMDDLQHRLQQALNHRDALEGYAEWISILARARSLGVRDVVLIHLSEERDPHALSATWEALLRRAQSRDALSLNGGALARLKGRDQERTRTEFQRLDREILALNQNMIRRDLLERAAPPEGVRGPRAADRTEMALLYHEIKKKTRYVPLRDLLKRSREAIRELKPVFMMSPRSVCQYLDIDGMHFDLVIIDEASQMKTEYAIGALARADQAIIVGDPLQLPPTDFFSRRNDTLADDVDAYADEKIDSESVLDQALSAFRPSRTLRWHYRSRHHALIAPSNRFIYGEELDLTPSPHLEDDRFGIHLERVPGLYKSSTNLIEARAVVERALHLMAARPEDSLGIVAMNQRQRELIYEEIDQAFQSNPKARQFEARWNEEKNGLESFFVKNLENVQGDERDIILVSCVYGPAEPGAAVLQRFGPINGAYGHRRLNVLFTRAKKQVQVFSSMDPSDIRVDEHSARGLRFLRDYLEFASTKRLDTGDFTGHEPDSPFEEWVLERLERLGYEGIPQVGVGGYRIDIGVRHPRWPQGFITGIECDGASYHSSTSARDRDRLREQVLKDLGWSLYRIWSTDWFNDPDGETRRLDNHLKKALSHLTESKSSAPPSVEESSL